MRHCAPFFQDPEVVEPAIAGRSVVISTELQREHQTDHRCHRSIISPGDDINRCSSNRALFGDHRSTSEVSLQVTSLRSEVHCIRSSHAVQRPPREITETTGAYQIVRRPQRTPAFLLAMASNLVAMASNLVAMASNLVAMASNLVAMASNLVAMASNLVTMASNLLAMASNLVAMASNLLAMASKWPPTW